MLEIGVVEMELPSSVRCSVPMAVMSPLETVHAANFARTLHDDESQTRPRNE